MTELNSVSMLPDTPFHTESYRIMSHETDPGGLVRPEILAAFFHETAWRHTEKSGLGFSVMKNRGQLWVIARFKLLFRLFPSRGDMILVRTWPRCCERIFTYRDFEAYDSRQRLLAAATGMWVIIDQETRKPMPLEFIRDSFKFHDRPALDSTLQRLNTPPKMTVAGKWHADWSDLDFNGHVNNINLIRWCLNAAPDIWKGDSVITSVEINYLSEGHLGDAGDILSAMDASKTEIHSVISKAGHELARLRFTLGRRMNDGR